MSGKRRNSSSPEPEDVPVLKKRRSSWMDHYYPEQPEANEEAQVDPIYGQRGAFPGLDDEDDGLVYGEPEDGVQYLRLVRSEARDVPHILYTKSTQPGIIEEQDENIRGYWEDGAYVAITNSSPVQTSSLDAQELYYSSLVERFLEMKTIVRRTPPLSAIHKLGSFNPISFPSESTAARRQWSQTIETTAPLSTQMACMDAQSIQNLIALLTVLVRRAARADDLSRINAYAVWVWAALARCRDTGELSSEEVAVIRELGKRAVEVVGGIRAGNGVASEIKAGDLISNEEDTKLYAPVDDDLGDTIREATERLNRAKPSEEDAEISNIVIEQLIPAVTESQIRRMLDIIITIIGEVYGQRDLLEHREIWEGDGE